MGGWFQFVSIGSIGARFFFSDEYGTEKTVHFRGKTTRFTVPVTSSDALSLKKDEGQNKLKTGTFRPCAPWFQCFKIACVLRSRRTWASGHEGTDDAVQNRSAMLLPILETEKKNEPKNRASDGVKRKNKHSGVAFELKSRGGSNGSDPTHKQHQKKKFGVLQVAVYYVVCEFRIVLILSKV